MVPRPRRAGGVTVVLLIAVAIATAAPAAAHVSAAPNIEASCCAGQEWSDPSSGGRELERDGPAPHGVIGRTPAVDGRRVANETGATGERLDVVARRGAPPAGVSPLPATGAATVVLLVAAVAVAIAMAWVLGDGHRRPRRVGRRT